MNAEETERILTEAAAFWAKVEILGRRTYYGRVTVESLGGAALLRVEIPALPEITQRERGYYRCEGEESAKYGLAAVTYPAKAGETHLVGIGSIYEITPMPEAILMTVYSKQAMRGNATACVRIEETKQIEAAADDQESDDGENIGYANADDEPF